MSQCKCGQEIKWIVTPSGKKAPVNVPPRKMWVKGYEESVTEGGGWHLEDCYESHFATCPFGNEFRKKHEN
jgi:hypothetical protein